MLQYMTKLSLEKPYNPAISLCSFVCLVCSSSERSPSILPCKYKDNPTARLVCIVCSKLRTCFHNINGQINKNTADRQTLQLVKSSGFEPPT